MKEIFTFIKYKKYSSIPEENGDIPFITSQTINNGVNKHIQVDDLKCIVDSNAISISTNGECYSSFYQNKKFSTSSDVLVIYNKYLNPYVSMFLITLLNLEKNKWSYGRKPKNNSIYDSKIKLPIDELGEPNWNYMENFIKKLPFSKFL